jgi:hypothetical protein
VYVVWKSGTKVSRWYGGEERDFYVFAGVWEVRGEFQNTEDHSNEKATNEPGWVG